MKLWPDTIREYYTRCGCCYSFQDGRRQHEVRGVLLLKLWDYWTRDSKAYLSPEDTFVNRSCSGWRNHIRGTFACFRWACPAMENLVSHWDGSCRFPQGDFSWVSLTFDEREPSTCWVGESMCVCTPRGYSFTLGIFWLGSESWKPGFSSQRPWLWGTIGLVAGQASLHTKSPGTGSKYWPLACSSFDGFFPTNPQAHYCQHSLKTEAEKEKQRKLHLERRLLCTLFTIECKKK